MPKNLTQLSVFVASPSDLEDERQRLSEIINEINLLVGQDYGVRLELVRWETHVIPGRGIDSQDVINRSINDNYDIFIGLLWHKFGTPTGRAGSGTEEEFLRAVRRFDQNPKSVHIMFYFKDQPVPPSEMSSDELAKIEKFKRELSDTTLYGKFHDLASFENQIRLHLIKKIQQFKDLSRIDAIEEIVKQSIVEKAALTPNDMMGSLDYAEIVEDNFSDLTQITGDISGAIESLAKEIGIQTLKLQEDPVDASTRHGRKRIKLAANAIAQEMANYSEFVRRSIPIQKGLMEDAINAVTKIISSMPVKPESKSDLEALEEFTNVLAQTKSSIVELVIGVDEFSRSVEEGPNLTLELNVARQELASANAALVLDMRTNISLFSDLELACKAALARGRSEGA